MKRIIKYSLIIFLMILVSCKNKKENNEPATFNTGKGLFVLNEGNFTYASSSLTFYHPDEDTVANHLFYRVNNVPIGDVGQSLTLLNNSLYIIVNNSNYIYKVNAQTIEYQAKLSAFYSPRHMLPVSNEKAYVSDLEGTGLWIINPSTMQHTGFIETGKSTEKMIKFENEVFITNWSNYYQTNTLNNTVQVIDINNDSLVDTILVSKEPNSIVIDKNNNLWVLCGGGYSGVKEPALFCINPRTRQIIKKFDFDNIRDYPSSLVIDNYGENLYFFNTGINQLDLFKMSINDDVLPTEAFIEAGSRMFYNVAISPDNELYITDVKNYVQNGEVFRYSSEGKLISSFSAGITPGFILFN